MALASREAEERVQKVLESTAAMMERKLAEALAKWRIIQVGHDSTCEWDKVHILTEQSVRLDHIQGQAVNGYEGGNNSAEWQEMAMARDESESEREGEGIHDLLMRMPGHLFAKGKDDEGEDDEGEDDEEHPGPEPSNAEVADNDKMDTASHEGQGTAEMVRISLSSLFGF